MTLTLYYNPNLPLTIPQLTTMETVALVYLLEKNMISSFSKISERIISVTNVTQQSTSLKPMHEQKHHQNKKNKSSLVT